MNGRWIWCNERRANTYCAARGQFELREMARFAMLRIVADSRYQVWLNGHYLGQGPTPWKPPYLFYDEYDVTARVETGINVVAVLANYHGVKHCTYTPGTPGILVEVEVTLGAKCSDRLDECRDGDGGRRTAIITDPSWKVRHVEGYLRDVPRRTWATAWCEYFDARREPVDWQATEYDDSAWPCATMMEPEPLELAPRMVPPLEEDEIDAVDTIGYWYAETGVPFPIGDGGAPAGLTGRLDDEPLSPVELLSPPTFPGTPLSIEADDRGFACAVDLGFEIAGQVEIDIECDEGTVIDLCPTENLRDGRPWCRRKGGEYARRYIARSGRQRWRCFGYDGIRYIHLVVRGPHGRVIIHRLGAWLRQSALPIAASFQCNVSRANRIWEITCRSMRVGSQEIHVDCPTREQTSAWGDHIWSGLWAGYLTGDFSALRHLVLTIEHTIMADGQLPCYPFSSCHDMSPLHDELPLYDYSLIAVWGLGVYLEATGDRALAERIAPACDRVLDWYRAERGESGLVELDGAAMWEKRNGLLFIDHPGLGTHNHPYPSLDRRGTNTALNCFFVCALDSQAFVYEMLGYADRASRLRSESIRMRTIADDLFYDRERRVYVDGYLEGKQLRQVSQQTNAMAVLSGVCPPARSREVLTRVLDPDDETLCRSATYFWLYLAEALSRSGMRERMFDEVTRLWDEMAKTGATTWWETFLGDDRDSLCHIWSCVPGYLFLTEALGVKLASADAGPIIISPALDLFESASGSVPVRAGTVEVVWTNSDADERAITVSIDSGATGLLRLPPRWFTDDGRSDISLRPGAVSIRARRL